MTDPISLLARYISLRRHASTVPTGILPLSSVRRATVFVDSLDSDSDPTRTAVQHFFSSRGISVNIICPQKWDVNWHGWLKKPDNTDPDMFLSLAYSGNFAAEYAARCSTAKFKVGRTQLKGDVFDMVLIIPEEQLILQHKAFEDITELLLKVE